MGVSGLGPACPAALTFLLMLGTGVTVTFLLCGAILYWNLLGVFSCSMTVSGLELAGPAALIFFIDGGDSGYTSFLALRGPFILELTWSV